MKKKDCSFSGKFFVWTLILPMKRYCMKWLSLRTNYAYHIFTTLLSSCLYNYVCTLSNKFKMCIAKGSKKTTWFLYIFANVILCVLCFTSYILFFLPILYFICIISLMMLIQLHTRSKKCFEDKYCTVLSKDVGCTLTYLYVTWLRIEKCSFIISKLKFILSTI